MIVDLTLTCPTCGKRSDMCFRHGDDWKKRPPAYNSTSDPVTGWPAWIPGEPRPADRLKVKGGKK